MQRTRLDRTRRSRSLRRKRLVVVCGAAAVLLLAAAAVWALSGEGARGDRASAVAVADAAHDHTTSNSVAVAASGAERSITSSDAAMSATYLAYSSDSSAEATLAEVPDVVGRRVSEAAAVLKAAGLKYAATDENGVSLAGTNGSGLLARVVIAQSVKAGTIVDGGKSIVLAVEHRDVTKVRSLAQRQFVVCIDPGHQSRGNSSKEPIGPGSSTKKAKVTGGATGVATRIPEYEIALQIAMNLKARLQKAGVKVVMTRTTNDVNISNSQRAQIANRAKVDLFVRIHANGSPDLRQAGLSVLYPAVTKWTRNTSAPSRQAAIVVQRTALASTGASSDGLHARSDQSGFNWCTQPAVTIECGYLSNRVEDRLLASPKYQDKLTAGIARGVVEWLGR